MIPLPFLITPTNVVIAGLAALLGVASLTTLWYRHQTTSLTAELITLKQSNQLLADTQAQQVILFTTTVNKQNESIQAFKRASDKQVQEMGKVQIKVDSMRAVGEQQIAELRKTKVDKFTCEQSMAFLVSQTKSLQWGVPK